MPIYRGAQMERCSFCKSACMPEHKGKVGPCGLGEIGGEAPGLEEAYCLDR